MNKNHVAVFTTCIISFFSFAQPILNATDFASAYSTSKYSKSISGNPFGIGGPDQLWDLSALTYTLLGTESVVPVNTAFYAENFPLANYCLMKTKSYQNSPTTYTYSFYKITATSYEMLGYSSTESSNYYVVYNDALTLYTFPYEFNTNIIDVFQTSLPWLPIRYESSYDAYGTLITPFGTYTNVARTKYTYPDDDDNIYYYSYFTTNPMRMIMSGTLEGPSGCTLTFFDNVALNAADLKKQDVFDIYPNPAHNVLHMAMNETTKIDKIAIADTSGRIVKTVNENLETIEISDLTNGLYLIQVFLDDTVITQKFLKE